MTVQGFCDPRLQSVREEFERNLAERGEVGASVCVLRDGEPLVDLWGGVIDRHTTVPWQRDTIGVVWSCTKGAVAVAAHLLAHRGQLDLDAPVSRYWPEFARHDKESIRVRWLLDHQAGLPVVRKPLRPGALHNWQQMVDALANEAPLWTPGTRQGYHASTFGHLVGEVIRRITSTDLGTFLREEIVDPLGLDFHLGLPAEHEARVARTIRADPVPAGEVPWRFLTEANAHPDGIQGLILRNHGRPPGGPDSREAHAAVLPSQGAITNARGLAGLYAPFATGGGGLVDDGTIARMQATSSASAQDVVLLIGLRFSLGFMKSSDNRAGPPGSRDSLILSPTAFGHAGMGGSLGFADPQYRLSFGYTMNKQGRGVLLNKRGQALVDAVYRSLGCRTNAPGYWV